jgi:putative restriction endonuclease
VRGFIANTDLEWHRLLRDQARTGRPFEEVNFWRPTQQRMKALLPGEPLLFRLKSPVNAIGGFGFFERYTALPAWLAWEAFGRANGVASLDELEARIREIRLRLGSEVAGELSIGCIALVEPVFFESGDYVPLPTDWQSQTVTGKAYDLTRGEGARVWTECLARAQGDVSIAADRPAARYGAPHLVRARLGQAGFRIAVLDAYGRSCAVTHEHSLPVLEAAHIRPFSEDGPHDVSNGLLLRSDVHRLFDRGYVTVTPDLRFRVSRRLRDDYANGKTYYALDGSPVAAPKDPAERPSTEALAWHVESRFLG